MVRPRVGARARIGAWTRSCERTIFFTGMVRARVGARGTVRVGTNSLVEVRAVGGIGIMERAGVIAGYNALIR